MVERRKCKAQVKFLPQATEFRYTAFQMATLGRMANLAALSIIALTLAVSCGMGGGSAVTLPPVTDPRNVQVDQTAASGALGILNTYRKLGSLDPVQLD